MTSSLPTSRVPDPAGAPALRWGVLAPGRIAAKTVDAVARHTRQRVVACGSRSLERAQQFAHEHGIERPYGSYAELLADPDVDAVYVASPHSHHAELALQVIDAGKHVLVEKAFTRNAAEARQVVEAARSAGVTCMEAMWTRFLPRTDIVSQLLADGALGDVTTFLADHGQYMAFHPASRLFDPALAGGALLDLGVYPVSYARFVFGAQPGRIQATGTLTETGVDAQVTALFDHYPGSDAHAIVTTTLAARTPCTAAICGTLARVELDGSFYNPGTVRFVTRDKVPTESGPPAIAASDGLCHQVAHFATLVAEGRRESPLLPLDETVAVMETLDELRAQVGVRYPGE